MTTWLLIDLAVLACVSLLTGIIIPQILLIAFRKKLLDEPDPRKIHKTEVPRLGGIAFFPSILLGLFLLYGFGQKYGGPEMTALLIRNLQSLCFVSSGAILLYLTGMADDLVGVRYKAKFVMQTLSALFVILGGLYLGDLHGLFWLHRLPMVAAVLVTVLLMVYIINAINLIDGIDGLASGLSAIACAFYTYVFFKAGLYLFSALSVATLGTLIPFFIYNMFGNPQKHKKIFMGDTGSLTIGLYLSVMSLRISRIGEMPDGCNQLVIAFAPLLIPCLDVVRVYLHRLRAHRNPFLPDKTHIHHKLLALGMPQRLAMVTIIAFATLLTLLNYWLSMHMEITWIFIADLTVWVGANALLTRAIHRRESRLNRTLYE